MKILINIWQKANTIVVCTIVVPGLILGFVGCKKLVDIPPPTNQLVTTSVFNNNATATSAVLYIYTQMFNNSESYAIAWNNGDLSDEIKDYSSATAHVAYYHNALAAASTYGEWNNAYNYIYQANAAISGLQEYSGTSPAVKQQLTGEAYFIRAFWHFYLAETYGAVPLALTTDYTVIDQSNNTPKAQVIQQVITDLQKAQSMLSSNYVDGTDTVGSADRVRPTKSVASALLARAYLYLGDYSGKDATAYTNAVATATSVINNSIYSLSPLTGTNEVFTKNSSETIWQLYTPLPASNNTNDAQNFILVAAPSTSSYTVSTQLLSAFESGDQRKSSWIGSVTAGGNTYYFPYKYKVRTGGNPINEYTMVLRLAEQYLIRAEGNAELNNVSAALADLNIIRNRAGLANYSGAQDQASILTAILHERQVELFTEWGHRWYDLCRAAKTTSTVNVNTVMGVVTPAKGGTWFSDGHQALYPIPLTEIQKDVHLTQNSGY